MREGTIDWKVKHIKKGRKEKNGRKCVIRLGMKRRKKRKKEMDEREKLREKEVAEKKKVNI